MSIDICNVSKSFGAFHALDNVSLSLKRGELTALLGPSGCGKTTLLRIIAGLESADAGTVQLGGRDATAQHVRDRNVGFVFQHYALFRHMSVFENVAFGLRVKPRGERPGEKAIRDRVMNLLSLVQLDWLADRFPSQLSGGQRQRVALARALAVEPQVLLLDEPFGALDAKVRKELRRWLRRLHDELHITSVFVTHDQEEAMEVADRVVLMNRGRVEQVGPPAEISEQPNTPFAFSFVGTANEFRGRIDGEFIRVGDARLKHSGTTLRDGAAVVAFARPHDLQVVPGTQCAGEGIPVRVHRVMKSGMLAHVELMGADHNGTANEPYFEVELPVETAAELGLASGQQATLISRRLNLFPEREPGATQ